MDMKLKAGRIAGAAAPYETPPGAAALARHGAPRLWAEFIALFVLVPLGLALFASQSWHLFTTFLICLAIGVALLQVTPGFRWRSQLEGPIAPHARASLVFIAGAAALIAALVFWLTPASFLMLPMLRPELMLTIALAYPLVSALPQEILFRTLFFERYGALFGAGPAGRWTAIGVNAATFGLAHAFYANWVAVGITALGSLFFAHAYLDRRSFALAVFWHSVAGVLVFALGLGRFLFTGAVLP
ncbi:MAG: CPBP family intramembrane glutamic endopeptidase [Pseudomonadota bacterium]